MAFTVETGDVIEGANSYVTVAFADSYHADRGNSSWAELETVQKQAMLVRATDFIEQEYGFSFIGDPLSDEQSLSWPRTNISGWFNPAIPVALQQAVCLLALEAITEDLNPSQARGGGIKREKTDVIETEYFDNAIAKTLRPAVSGILRKLLSSSSPLNGRVIRV